MKIAKAAPFSGKPKILTPKIFGASTGKEFIYRIPVIGKRPILITVDSQTHGLKFNNGVIYGKIDSDCEFTIKITAENQDGKDVSEMKVSIAQDNMLKTPLLGFTTWNAFGSGVSQRDVEETAELMISSGIADYGYCYVNVDSGWQKEYGGKYDAIMPNDKFPNMKKMCDKIHNLGMRAGIYSTPMLTAWGCPKEFNSIPGCTRGEPNILLTNVNGGIGTQHCEENNVKQWEEWGFDYLKYDWYPSDPYTADFMKQALLRSKREIAFCVTVNAVVEYGNYWSKNCAMWRASVDSMDNWDQVIEIFNVADTWKPYVHSGHFYDLDMLEIGHNAWNLGNRGLTDNEELFCYTMRAFFCSPIQLSCHLDKLTEFEFNMICNEEIIAINQDSLADYPVPVKKDENVRIYKRDLDNGDIAYAIFNMTDKNHTEVLEIPENSSVRDVWLKENITSGKNITCKLESHGVIVLRVSPVKGD